MRYRKERLVFEMACPTVTKFATQTNFNAECSKVVVANHQLAPKKSIG